MEKTGIVLNKMYTGDYLNNNLGHEVINFFKADNDKHYIYLNSTGNFAEEHTNKIGQMLFVKHYVQGVFEVIGKAEGLKDVPGTNMPLSRNVIYNDVERNIFERQKKYVNETEGGVLYGGKSIFDIFNDAEQQSIFITYKAKKVYRTKKGMRIFICCKNSDVNILEKLEKKEKENLKIVELSEYNQASTSLKQYIYPTKENSGDYNNLLELINNPSLWEDNIEKIDINKLKLLPPSKVSLFDICQIQNNENCFSNALAYFMTRPEYYELWKGFFGQYGISLNENFSIKREVDAKIEDKNYHEKNPGRGRIDLLISDENNIVIIENKIKSDINKIAADKDDSDQLNRYFNYVNWAAATTPNKYFFILTPKYNIPTISEEMEKIYKIITYADLYDYLKDNLFVFYNDANFVAFLEAIERHTHENVNDYLYYEMMNKFFRRINK